MTSERSAPDEALHNAARVSVTVPRVPSSSTPAGYQVLEVTDPAAIRQLLSALAVEEVIDGVCMCFGDFALTFFDAADEQLASATFHHAHHLRWTGRSGSAVLRDGVAALRWLAGLGIAEPLSGHERRRRAHQEMLLAEQRWLDAAPAAVRDLAEAAVLAAGTTGLIGDLVPSVARRLEEALPDPVERAAATLAWYGSGTGRPSGYPVNEKLPVPALVDTPLRHIIAALQIPATDERVAAGALLHLCAGQSRPHLAEDIAGIPAEVRERLVTAARRSDDPELRYRAEVLLGTDV